jgi:single-strand DNA-binding protein
VGKDAETRFTPDGKAVTQFSVALQSGFGDRQVTTWLNCSYWGERGEKVSKYLTKGTRIGITGELTNRPYTDKQGVEKYSLELRVSDVTLLGSKSDAVHETRTSAKAEQSDGVKEAFDNFSDDVPFDNPYKGRKSYVV